MNAIRDRCDARGHPARLHLVQGVLVGDGRGRGQGRLAVDGLITSMVYSWCGLSPEFMTLIRAGKLEAWNLPFGVGEPTPPPPTCCNRMLAFAPSASDAMHCQGPVQWGEPTVSVGCMVYP